MTYSEKLKDPRWQRKRLLVFDRAGWACENCGCKERTLHVHHLIYSKGQPWESPDKTLECLCQDCHAWRTRIDGVVGKRRLLSTKMMTSDAGVQSAVRKLDEVQKCSAQRGCGNH